MIALDRRALCLGALELAGCATLPPSPDPPGLPITLANALTGRATGRGVFLLTSDGSERRFTARHDGRLRRDTLAVIEDFDFDDGQTDRLTPVFTRQGTGWTGRREDTVGTATVEERPDGPIVNEAIVTRLGLPIGRVRFGVRPR